jgi:hypothetical protein
MYLSTTSDAPSPSPDAIEFVRFCYRRRRVGWPELYDEMCAVAGRGLFRGWRFAELADRGIGFSLHETPGLARIAAQIADEEGDRRGRGAVRVVGRRGVVEADPVDAEPSDAPTPEPEAPQVELVPLMRGTALGAA